MRFRLLQGTHTESDPTNWRLKTYTVGDVIETDKDLCAAFNREDKHGLPHPPRFERLPDEQPAQ